MIRHLTPALAAALLLTAACQRSAPDEAEEADTHPRTTENAVVDEHVVIDESAEQGDPAEAELGDARRAASASLGLGAELLERLDGGDQNLLFSPYSITSALHLALLGAEGETATSIEEALQLGDGDTYHPDMFALRRALTAGDDVALNIANRFYVEQTREPAIRSDYRSAADAYYGAGLGLADFQGAPEDARREINAWVSSNTAQMIPELLQAGSVDTRTVSVLVNAIHFLGDWQVPFDVNATTEGSFTTSSGDVIERPLMRRVSRMVYAEDETMQAVALPYEGREWALHVVLPREGQEAAVGAALLTGGARSMERMGSEQVALTLPRFEATWKASLRQPLTALGMGAAFSNAADFTGLLNGGGITISDVIHEAVIVVDERGTEAAAATGAMMRATSMPPPPVEMTVNRPFYIVLVHEPTSTPLFIGHIVNPDVARERD